MEFQEQVHITEREEEKRVNRIYSSWRRLIKGIILRDRLRVKYGDFKYLKKESSQELKINNSNEIASIYSIAEVDSIISKSPIMLKKPETFKKNKIAKKSSRAFVNCNSKKAEKEKSLLVESDDFEEENEVEKLEKMRSILQWNPKSATKKINDPWFNDLSGDEQIECRPSSSITLFRCNFNNKTINRRRRNTYSSSSSEGENSFSIESKPRVKRARRQVSKTDISYKESDQSKSDITVSESETADGSYIPFVEGKKNKTLFSDTDSE